MNVKSFSVSLCFAIALFSVVLGSVSLHLFILLALADTKNDQVKAACGGADASVWRLVLAQPLVFWTIVIVFDGFGNETRAYSAPPEVLKCQISAFWLYAFACLVMWLMGRAQSEIVRANAACMDSLRAHSLGMERALLIDMFDVLHWMNFGVLVVATMHLAVRLMRIVRVEVQKPAAVAYTDVSASDPLPVHSHLRMVGSATRADVGGRTAAEADA